MKPKKETPKTKQPYTIKVECLIPATLIYTIHAFDEQEALELIKKQPPKQVLPKVNLQRLIKATVYTAGSTMIKLTKYFAGK